MARERLFALLLGICLTTMQTSAAEQSNDPVAEPRAIVLDEGVRFTVLTSRLIRLEWSARNQFEDHASLVVVHRRLPVPAFSVANNDGWLTITTDDLVLRYRKGSGKFTPKNLDIRLTLNDSVVTWKPGMNDRANLRGTTRTLDGVEGSTPLEPGLLSRDGWTVIDDSSRPLFDTSAWPWVMQRPDTTAQDWYFFGYGHHYREQLHDFTKIAGKIPMPPRFAFGLWWSRYWAYTDQEFMDLVREFEAFDVPLDVLVIDMDWHQTFNLRWGKQPKDQAGLPLGWTGYTWDKNFFPDPPAFLRWCKDHGLHTPLNLHPASGIQPHEEHYPEMARAMGIDPATKKYIPFDVVDKKFSTNYFAHIIRPLEEQGVDFWWLDWQQWGTTKIPGVTPTWWLNYVHFTDMERQGKARPLLFHRWGGLGNHRYQIGFSGDTYSVWKSLAFQPYFTATAANVGFGYWSHDIGGHMPGPISPELYTRWIQFGVFSPILRTHTTKNPDAERRIWAYPPENFRIMRDAIRLRYALVPYIYTEARKTYDTGVALCHPLYYDSPERDEAYDYTGEYCFGDRMLVAPVTDSLSRDTLLSRKQLWLPKGEWFEWSSGSFLSGPAAMTRSFALDEIPLYVRSGSIIPMAPPMRHDAERPVDPLILTVIPGEAASYDLYEDGGNSTGYQKDEYAVTPLRMTMVERNVMDVQILPPKGSYPGIPLSRAYELKTTGLLPPKSVIMDGKKIPFAAERRAPSWCYDGERLTTLIALPTRLVSETTLVRITWEQSVDDQKSLVDGVPGLLARLQHVMKLINNQWPKEWSPDSLVAAVQTGNRITRNPATAQAEIVALKSAVPQLLRAIRMLEIREVVRDQCLRHLEEYGVGRSLKSTKQ